MSKLRLYTYERINKMSMQERLNAIELVKTSDTLTTEEKRENLRRLAPKIDTNPIMSEMLKGMADTDDFQDHM